MWDEHGLNDRGGASWAAAQLGQDLPALEGGDGTLADRSDTGVASLTAFCRRDKRGRCRWRLNGVRIVPPAPWYPLSANVITSLLVKASTRPTVRAAVRSWTAPGRADEAQTSPPAGSVTTACRT